MDEKRKKHSTGPKETARSFVIINGKHVEGIDAEADEIVQAGKVYPIYTFEPNRSEDKWNCSVCDTENSNRNTTCCVCGQAKKNFSNDSTGVGTSTQNQNNGGDLGKNKDNADGINPTRQKSTSKIKWIILGLLLIIAVVGVVYATLIWKNSDESKKLNKPNSSSIVSSSVSTKERNEETSNALSESSMSVSSTVTSEPTSSDSSKSEPASTTSSEVVVYTITYRVSGNGTLSSDGKSGKSSLEYSTSGTASGQSFTVTAVPGTNSQFVRWSDGETKATRTDTNISESKTLTAYFEEKTVPEYSVIYRVSGNGTLNSGNTSGRSKLQYSVPPGSGKSITVTAVPGNNYHFVRWSDGVTNATRTDSNIGGNIDLTAYFEENSTAPAWSTSASVGSDGIITVTVDSAGQSIKVSVKMVYVADPTRVYSMGTIGTWTTGNYRFEPSCPGDSGEYSIRFYDQNEHLLTSVNMML